MRACRLATPAEVAKIGAEGHDDDDAADRETHPSRIPTSGSSSVRGVLQHSKSLVRRYQSLVCSVAYSACGNLALERGRRSGDVLDGVAAAGVARSSRTA